MTSTLGDDGVEANTYRFKPFGGLLAKTGLTADPVFLWRGAGQFETRGQLLLFGRACLHIPSGAWNSANGSTGGLGSRTFAGGRLGGSPGLCGVDIPWKALVPTEVHIKSNPDFFAAVCGAVHFTTYWVLPSGTQGPGTIIQHIRGSRHHHNCRTDQVYDESYNYIEAWDVDKQGNLTAATAYGFDSFNDRTGGEDCLEGNYELEGKSGYYRCKVEAGSGWIQGHFKLFGKEGDLLYWGHPNGGAPPDFVDGPSKKFVKYEYNCCVEVPGSVAFASFQPEVSFTERKGYGWRGKDICKSACETTK